MIRTARQPETLERIRALWVAATTTAFHGLNCRCAGGVPLQLDPATLEEDVLDYLETRYRAGRQPALLDIIAARRAERRRHLTDWLDDLARRPEIAAQDAQTVVADVAGVLTSIQAQSFACR